MANKKQSIPTTVEETSNLIFQQFPTIGKTVCTLKADPTAFYKAARKILYNNSDMFELDVEGTIFNIPTQVQSTYKGIVKVNEKDGDVFDANTGKELAKEKAIDKFQDAMEKDFRYFLTQLHQVEAAVEHYMDMHDMDYYDVPDVSDIKYSKFKNAYD